MRQVSSRSPTSTLLTIRTLLIDDRLLVAAIAAMLRLPDYIGLPDPRLLVPETVAIQRRHPQLNVGPTLIGQ